MFRFLSMLPVRKSRSSVNGWGYGFQARNPKDKMRLALDHWRSHETNSRSWQDSDGARLENHLREIAIELIVAGEQHYRDGLIRHREWLIQYKAELDERERQRKAEEERKGKERQAKLESQRVDHLLGQAQTLHQAQQIREFVAAIQEANKTAPDPMSVEELNSWTQWGAHAGRLDRSGCFRKFWSHFGPMR